MDSIGTQTKCVGTAICMCKDEFIHVCGRMETLTNPSFKFGLKNTLVGARLKVQCYIVSLQPLSPGLCFHFHISSVIFKDTQYLIKHI